VELAEAQAHLMAVMVATSFCAAETQLDLVQEIQVEVLIFAQDLLLLEHQERFDLPLEVALKVLRVQFQFLPAMQARLE